MQRDLILEKLREQGCRITRQRLMILDIILEEECSCCKEIFYRAQEKDRKVGAATVYRMVNALEQAGAISRKNLYRIRTEDPVQEEAACNVVQEEAECLIRLSDGSVCCLSLDELKKVMNAGLKKYGYMKEQKITGIEMVRCPR